MQTNTEVTRVADHIAHAMQQAASREVSQLSHVQQLIRTLLLDELERYRVQGRFPKNPDFAERTPYFVDAEGTRCAMAHLIELGGQAPLVERIATGRNNARVRELADEPGLLAWLDAAGLSVDEAAAIQPSYSCDAKSDCVCGGTFSGIQYSLPAKGVLEVVVESQGIAARVEQVYGDTLGIGVGATISLSYARSAGTRVLVPIDRAPDAGQMTYAGVDLQANGNYQCTSQSVHTAPALTKSQFAQAVTAANCPQTLASIDSEWGRGCSEPVPKTGCSVGGSEASVGLLLALVSAIVYRRLTAR